MMTCPGRVAFYNRAVALLAQITYKDWTFHVADEGDGHPFLQVRFLAPDARAEATYLQYGRNWRITEHMTDAEIVQTALKAVLTAEEHEAREQFRFRGRAIFGPHFALDALCDAYDASKPDARESDVICDGKEAARRAAVV